jgi:hypothetical protein
MLHFCLAGRKVCTIDIEVLGLKRSIAGINLYETLDLDVDTHFIFSHFIRSLHLIILRIAYIGFTRLLEGHPAGDGLSVAPDGHSAWTFRRNGDEFIVRDIPRVILRIMRP